MQADSDDSSQHRARSHSQVGAFRGVTVALLIVLPTVVTLALGFGSTTMRVALLGCLVGALAEMVFTS